MAPREPPPFSRLHAQMLLECPPDARELKRLFMMEALIRETEVHYDRADTILLRPMLSKYLLSVVADARSGTVRRSRGATGDIGGHIEHLIRSLGAIPAERVPDASSSMCRWVAIAKELQKDPKAAEKLIEVGEASEGILRAALGGVLGYITSECGRCGTPIRPWVPPKAAP